MATVLTSQLVPLLERWRDELKLNNRQFAEEFLGRSESEWAMYRSQDPDKLRWPSKGFFQAVQRTALERGEKWRADSLADAYSRDALAKAVAV